MSNTQKMREALAKRQAEQAKREETRPAPLAALPVKAPREKGPQLKHACGHMVGLKQYEGRECDACRTLKKLERNKVRQEEKRDVRLKMEKNPADQGRLPDGAVFNASYDAPRKRWTGYLTLSDGVTFMDDSGAVMKLLKKLDLQYREWLKTQLPAAPSPVQTDNPQ